MTGFGRSADRDGHNMLLLTLTEEIDRVEVLQFDTFQTGLGYEKKGPI